MRLISYLVWKWFGAYTVDQAMIDGMLDAIEEEGARQARAHG
jgi:hypothetical protein